MEWLPDWLLIWDGDVTWGTYHSIGSWFLCSWGDIGLYHSVDYYSYGAYRSRETRHEGAAINVENIGKHVTDGFEKVNDYVRSDRPRSIFAKDRGGDCVCGRVPYQVPACFHCYLLCACIVCIIDVFFALLMAATGLIAALPAVLYEVLPAVNWATVGSSPGLTVAMSVAGILVIGIPYYRTDTHADASFWRLATHVHCN